MVTGFDDAAFYSAYPGFGQAWLNFNNTFTLSFYACRSRKRKKTDDLTVFFTLWGSSHVER